MASLSKLLSGPSRSQWDICPWTIWTCHDSLWTGISLRPSLGTVHQLGSGAGRPSSCFPDLRQTISCAHPVPYNTLGQVCWIFKFYNLSLNYNLAFSKIVSKIWWRRTILKNFCLPKSTKSWNWRFLENARFPQRLSRISNWRKKKSRRSARRLKKGGKFSILKPRKISLIDGRLKKG